MRSQPIPDSAYVPKDRAVKLLPELQNNLSFQEPQTLKKEKEILKGRVKIHSKTLRITHYR